MRISPAPSPLAVLVRLGTLGAALAFGSMIANAQQSYSIRGVTVSAERLGSAYEKAVGDYVYGDGLRQPVTETAYIKAWETYRSDQQQREREKQERQRALQQQYRNNRSGNYNQNYNQNRNRGTSSTIKAGTSNGISVRDKSKPSFIEVEAVVVRPGKDAIVMDEGGSYYKVESQGVLTKTGRAQLFKLKKDPEGRTDTFRTAKGSIEVKLYQDYTLSERDFLNYLRKGELNEIMPELRQTASGFQRGPAGGSRGLGESKPNTARGATNTAAANTGTADAPTNGTTFKRKSALEGLTNGAGTTGTTFKRKSALDGVNNGGSSGTTFKRKSALEGLGGDKNGGAPAFKRKSALGGKGDGDASLQQRSETENFSRRTTTLKR